MTTKNPLGLAAHHITGSVIDIDRAVEWYQRVLGFTLLDRGAHQTGALQYAELKAGNFGIGLIQLSHPAARPDRAKPVAPSWLHMVFAVEDPDATYRLLKARGADVFTRGPHPAGPLASFLIHDSEGNEIEIVAASMTARNRAIVLAFVELLYRQRQVRLAFERYVTPGYVQHNPNIADGREAAITALEPLFSSPQASFDVKRILIDGDLAAIHLHGRRSPATLGGAVVDLFRLWDGKIVEHWDVLQPVPESAANPHPMF